jgi:SAM-dependent methyltransferase
MGSWSKLVGGPFLNWLDIPPGRRWIDVGCGTGALTEMLYNSCSPAHVCGVDPSEASLAYARANHSINSASFCAGIAEDLPFTDTSFDAAVMALAIFFVREPLKAVSEMVRVVGPGGVVATYAWDMLGGGFPDQVIREEIRKMGIRLSIPRSFELSQLHTLIRLWTNSKLTGIETKQITVQKDFCNFEEFWNVSLLGGNIRRTISTMAAPDVERLRKRVFVRVSGDDSRPLTCIARANAVKGRVLKS